MSSCAYVPPYLPDFAEMETAFVFFANSLTLILKLLSPRFFYDFFKTVKVEIGIVNIFQVPIYSSVLRFLSQSVTKNSPSLALSMSVIQI